MSSRAIRLELGPGSGAHTWHLRLWSKATRSQCTEGLGGEKGAERVEKGFECCESAEVAEGGSDVRYHGGCTRVGRVVRAPPQGAARVDLGLGQGRP